MKKILGIAKRDFKAIITNWVMLVVTIGLIILPSLYAWFNIKSSWDPYGNTKGIKVAIVNEDTGSIIKDQTLNIGDMLVEKLKENTNMGWRFISKDEAENGVELGKYYASIIIPEDFTKSLTSILDGKLIKPRLIYTVNEKSNAIAPKITDKGVSTIKDEVDAEIVKTVDEVLLGIINEAGITVINQKDKIEKIANVIYYLDNNINEIEDSIRKGNEGIDKINEISSKLSEFMPNLEVTLTDGMAIMEEGKGYLEEGKVSFENLNSKIKKDFDDIIASLNKVKSKIEEINPSEGKEELLKKIDKVTLDINALVSKLDGLISTLERVNKILNNVEIKNTIASLKEAKEKLSSIVSYIGEIKVDIENKNFEEVKNQLLKIFDEGLSKIEGVYNKYDSEIAPFIKKAADYGINTLNLGISFFEEAKGEIPNINNILNLLNDKSVKISKDVDKVLEAFPSLKESLHSFRLKIDEVKGKGDLTELESLLDINPKEEGSFLSSPIEVEENVLFHIPNYGSAMSPFFTTLALWVGALILMSLLAVDPPHGDIEYTPAQKYFGKLITFTTIGVLQGLTVSLGDIYILKAYVKEPMLFIIFSMFISLIFMIIIYTLVSTLGNVGKAIGVILLVLQISSSGGTFPVEVMPTFFKIIHPTLPFTYAIGLMRDATGGVVRELLIKNISVLILFGVLFIIIGVLFKGYLNRKGEYFKEKLKKSGMLGH